MLHTLYDTSHTRARAPRAAACHLVYCYIITQRMFQVGAAFNGCHQLGPARQCPRTRPAPNPLTPNPNKRTENSQPQTPSDQRGPARGRELLPFSGRAGVVVDCVGADAGRWLEQGRAAAFAGVGWAKVILDGQLLQEQQGIFVPPQAKGESSSKRAPPPCKRKQVNRSEHVFTPYNPPPPPPTPRSRLPFQRPCARILNPQFTAQTS